MSCPAQCTIRLWLKRAPSSPWPADGLRLLRLPFVIGRSPGPCGEAPLRHVDLCLPDTDPYQLSPVHFCILAIGDGLSVLDLDSDLGTRVNGIAIGRASPRRHASLRTGSNIVAAGPRGSRWVFDVHIGDAVGHPAPGREFTFG
ncbi:MAG: FHA domain-containing protein [Gammaproteobacteria bacterium]